MAKNIIYEHPLNERNRLLMRLEYLFNKIDHFLLDATNWEALIAVQTLIEMINILERNDISTDIIKELDRYQINLTKLLDVPAVDSEALSTTLTQLDSQLKSMQAAAGKHTKQLRNDELLNSIRQKMALSSNLCSFDIPALHYWLHQNSKAIQSQFDCWLQELANIKVSIKLILNIMRNSAKFSKQTANCGFFQTSLAHGANYQIIRIKLPNSEHAFPEISGNKHRITIRFLTFTNASERPQQEKGNVQFELSCCAV